MLKPSQAQIESEVTTKTLDELLRELNTPRQSFDPPPPEPGQPQAPEQHYGPGSDFEAYNGYAQPRKYISPEAAKRTGERAAKLVDGVISFGASSWAKDTARIEEYQASEAQKEDIAEALGDLAQESGWEIPPGIAVFLLILFVYLPIVIKANENRKLNKLEDDVADLQKFKAATERKQAKEEQENNSTPS